MWQLNFLPLKMLLYMKKIYPMIITKYLNCRFKISIQPQGNDDLLSRYICLSPDAGDKINELLNTPDFIKLESKDITLFWIYRY